MQNSSPIPPMSVENPTLKNTRKELQIEAMKTNQLHNKSKGCYAAKLAQNMSILLQLNNSTQLKV